MNLSLKNKKSLNWLVCFAWLLIGACANIVTPSGGPSDVTAPKVLKTTPLNNSKEFKETSFKIDFDEFVVIKDAATQVVVSPFMKEAPELKVRGKSVIVDFKDTLKPNTTYSIAFGNALTDLNAGNILADYRFTFSTGNTIDSLTLKGIVKNAFTQKAEPGVIVMLYDKNYDSIPYKETPFYISKTDEAGAFKFSSTKGGKFKLFAIKDANGDFLFSDPEEKIAFSDSLITPQPTDTAKADSLRKNRVYNLYLFDELPVKQRLLKASSGKYGRVVLIFRKPVEELLLKPLNANLPESWCIRDVNKTKDTITLWLKDPDKDSLVLQISDKNGILDTAELSLTKKSAKQTRGKGEDLANVALQASASNNGTFDYYKPFLIQSTLPLASSKFQKIILTENKDTVKAAFKYNDSINKCVLVDYKWKEDAAYSLLVPAGTFTDIFGKSNDTLKIKFRTTSLSDYGNIKLSLTSTEINCNLIVQLITESDAVVQEKFSTLNDVMNFTYVAPGTYKIKVICDENQNKKWDTGDYMKKVQPEKVFVYPFAAIVKGNWDTDLEWNVVR
jgi:uncharacterized protein (DUF2141 family)